MSYKCHMSVLAIRISDKQKALLATRAKEAGVSTGALVRDLIKAEPIVTSADLLKEMKAMVGAQNLRAEQLFFCKFFGSVRAGSGDGEKFLEFQREWVVLGRER